MTRAKRFLILSGFLLLALPTSSVGTELAARFSVVRETGGIEDELLEIPEGMDRVYWVDTATKEWDLLTTHTPPSRGEYAHIATGPDGKLFYWQTEGNRDAEGDYRGTWYRIFSLTPETGIGGSIVYRDERVEYELYVPEVGDTPPLGIWTIRTGPGDDPESYALYFYGGDHQIYRVLDVDSAESYYTVDDDHLVIPACPALGRWNGEFDFDDDGNLYLSTGNTIPSGLFRARRLPRGTLDDTPEPVLQRLEGGMQSIVYADEKLYFYERTSEHFTVFELDLGTLALVEVFANSDPLRSVLSLAALPSPGLIDPPPGGGKSLPDLRPSDLSFGAPRLVPGDDDPRTRTLELPLWVSLENLADAVAPPFLLHFEARLGSDKPIEAEFIRAGHAKGSPALKSGLPEASSVALGGTLRLLIPKGLQVEGTTLQVRATVDSCQGETKMPATCRVQESDEKNNVLLTQVKLPLRLPPR